MTDKKARPNLKELFLSGKIPTQSDFADLIESGINQKDDGLQKAFDTALKIQAPDTTDAKAPKDLILFYEKIDDADAKWRMGTRSGGLEIGRGTIQADFFIDVKGNVGIGTTEPNEKLMIEGSLNQMIKQRQNGAMPDGSPYDVGGITYSDMNLYDSTESSPAAYLKIRSVGANKDWMRTIRGTQLEFGTVNGQEGPGTTAKTRMIIDASGNVGIGTVNPRRRLEVTGDLQLSGVRTKLFYRGDSDAHIGSLAFYSPNNGNTAIITPYNSAGENLANSTISFGGFGSFEDSKVSFIVSGNVGIGTTDPKAKLQVVGGAIMPAVGNSEAAGIFFPPDAFGGGKDRAYIRYYARSGETAESTTLEIGNQNDLDDHISLMPGGKVGIGILIPTAKLEVKGRIKDQTGFVMPVGSITAFGGAVVPEGWLLCNGQAIPGDVYSELRDVLGLANVPDLRGRTLICVASNHPLNQTGGAEEHRLAESEMPKHRHAGFGEAYDDFPLGVEGPKGIFGSRGDRDFDNYYYNTTYTGGGGAHNNMQPYYVVNYIIKY